MFNAKLLQGVKMLSVSIVTGGIFASLTGGQSAVQSPAVAPKPPVLTPYRNQPDRLAKRAVAFYEAVWGIEAPSVKAVESGVIIRFNYRILDPFKAKQLNDKKAEPSLEDPQAGVKLVVPAVDQVGLLRQSSTPIAGRSYWMAFSNPGRRVKPGDRVNVVIGHFRANGLEVE